MTVAIEIQAPNAVSYRWKGGLIVDNFAGGGGASTGIAQGIGRSPDIAVNHNAQALAMHEENHPETKHYNESVWDVDIREVTGGQPVLMGWFSPDCTHFSVAKGGKPVKKAIRGLAWIVKKWWGQSDLAIIKMENVVEFMTWGPLIAARCKTTGRVLKLVPDGKDKKGQPKFKTEVAAKGEYVPYRDQALVPDKKRAGKTFRQFIKQMRNDGYTVEWVEKGMVASDYGDPTTRKRFFLIARKDGLPIVWPEPTHGNPKKYPERQPWKTAGENLDWGLECPSIFKEGRKQLAENTLKRIARGIQKFVVEAGDNAFLVKTNHGYDQFRGQSLDDPLQTITGKLGTGVVAASLMKFRGDSAGADLHDPLPTITAGGGAARPAGAAHAMGVSAVTLTKFNQNSIGQSADEPLDTVMAGATRFGAVECQLAETGFVTTIDHGGARSIPGSGLDEPISTVTNKARHVKVAALLKHFTGVTGQELTKPLPTITATDHNSIMTCQLQELQTAAQEGQVELVGHIQRDFGNSVGHSADEPLGAITAGGGGKSALVASSLMKMKGSCQHGQPLDEPIGTIQAQGNHFAQVQAFLMKFYSTGSNVQSLHDPLATIGSVDTFGLVTIHGVDYQIVDIGMRMLEPHELYRCQGFPADYQHASIKGKKLPKHAQVRMVGNSVPPGLARALVEANVPRWAL